MKAKIRFGIRSFWPNWSSSPFWTIQKQGTVHHSLQIYPHPMVWPLPRPWSQTMVSDPLWAQKTLEIKAFLGLGAHFWIWSCRPRDQEVGVDPCLLSSWSLILQTGGLRILNGTLFLNERWKISHWEIIKKGGFVKGWFWRTCPRSGFRSGGTSAETTLLETALLRTPEYRACLPVSEEEDGQEYPDIPRSLVRIMNHTYYRRQQAASLTSREDVQNVQSLVDLIACYRPPFRASQARNGKKLAEKWLECRKWGFKRWGLKQIRGYLRKKAFFLRYPRIFPGAIRTLRKRAKKAGKGRFWPISRTGGQTHLKPPFVTPPFAALQNGFRPRPPGNSHTFLVGPKSIFRPLFYCHFGPEARNGSVPGHQDRNSGEWKREPEALRGFLLEIPQNSVCGEWGGWAKFFFEAEIPTKKEGVVFAHLPELSGTKALRFTKR